jgi:glycerol kinase
VKKLYIDGGFNANPIFVGMLRDKLAGISIETTDFALGTALGAVMLVN